jgi:3-deoxy-D-manno-octulosonic-acid transferase
VLAVHVASLWNGKAKQWISGRQNLFEELKTKLTDNSKIIWMHCSSAGEFEQGKPVLERLKKEYPHYKILVTFFSSSGFNVAKRYTGVDFVSYLPADTSKNAKQFLDIVKPQLVVFVKYEFWYHHLSQAAYRHIPLLLVSAVFRKDQFFFKWYGRFYKQMLFLFRHIFVQDEASLQLLQENSIMHCSIGGDTRFDRVKEIAENFSPLNAIEHFTQDKPTIVAGSTWPDDEKLLAALSQQEVKLIIAPHEINKEPIQSLQKLFPHSILYSQIKEAFTENIKDPLWHTVQNETGGFLKKQLAEARALIIDNVGMLSRLYHYATITYIGGGFTKDGIHNTLEAAVYGKPVIFGPNYKKYREAKELIDCGGGFSIATAEELNNLVTELLHKNEKLHRSGEASKKYIDQNTGATEKVLQFIQANRLLTR